MTTAKNNMIEVKKKRAGNTTKFHSLLNTGFETDNPKIRESVSTQYWGLK